MDRQNTDDIVKLLHTNITIIPTPDLLKCLTLLYTKNIRDYNLIIEELVSRSFATSNILTIDNFNPSLLYSDYISHIIYLLSHKTRLSKIKEIEKLIVDSNLDINTPKFLSAFGKLSERINQNSKSPLLHLFKFLIKRDDRIIQGTGIPFLESIQDIPVAFGIIVNTVGVDRIVEIYIRYDDLANLNYIVRNYKIDFKRIIKIVYESGSDSVKKWLDNIISNQV